MIFGEIVLYKHKEEAFKTIRPIPVIIEDAKKLGFVIGAKVKPIGAKVTGKIINYNYLYSDACNAQFDINEVVVSYGAWEASYSHEELELVK